MHITFTKHAKIRQQQREISENDIEAVIENPDNIKESFKKRIVARKKFSKETLEVVYKQSEQAIVIITCYWIKEG